MKRIIFISIIGLLATMGLNAQKAYKDGTKVILDMTSGAGMPLNAGTTTPKTWGGTPSNTSGPLANNTSTGSINATVYHKLEIAPADVNMGSVISYDPATGTFTMDWVTAINACKNSGYEGGGWRLPTQRELQMMWIFKPALENLGVSAFWPEYYWCATEDDPSLAYSVNFISGGMNNGNNGTLKTNNARRARCVREL